MRRLLRPRLRGALVRRIWTRQSVIEELRKLGRYRTCGEVSRRQRSLVVYAFKFFGSWRGAMEAAKIPGLKPQWSRSDLEHVLAGLLRRDGYVDCRNLRVK